MLLRSLLELVINLWYLAIHPNDTKRFLDYHWVQVYRDHQNYAKYYDSSHAIPKEVQEQYTAVLKEHNYRGHYWSNVSLRDRATKVGLDFHYDIVYALHSDYLHTNVGSLGDQFQTVADQLHLVIGASPKGVDRVLVSTFELLLRLADKTSDILALGWDRSLQDFLDRGVSLFRISRTKTGAGDEATSP